MKAFVLSGILSLMFSINGFAQNDEVTRTEEPDGITLLTYIANDEVVKTIRINESGIRTGISEEWHKDGIEVDHIRYLYDNGILKEITFLMPDGSLREKSTFENGVEKSYIHISAVYAKQGSPSYIKKVYNNSCGFMMYTIVDEMIVDSMFVEKGR